MDILFIMVLTSRSRDVQRSLPVLVGLISKHPQPVCQHRSSVLIQHPQFVSPFQVSDEPGPGRPIHKHKHPMFTYNNMPGIHLPDDCRNVLTIFSQVTL